MIAAKKIIDIYGLVPLPGEGGYYRETYRSGDVISVNHLPKRYAGDRTYCTSIYYLLTSESKSFIHRIKSDEIIHFYSGDPVEMLFLYPDGMGKTVTLGSSLSDGNKFQQAVPHGIWLGMQLKAGGKFAFMGTTVSPGFEFDDLELGSKDKLIIKYPEYEKKIKELTA